MIHQCPPGSKALTRRRLTAVLPVAATLFLAEGCGSSSGTSSAAAHVQACGGVPAASMTVAAPNYLMSLVVGPMETMYSPSEVSSQHPTSGEVMLRGEMSMQPAATGGGSTSSASSSGGSMGMGSNMNGMDMNGMTAGGMTMQPSDAGGQVRHLEIHICTPSGAVVTNANPSIRLYDATNGATVAVPVAVMQGVASGSVDLHYGNNVLLTPGHSYSVEVALNNTTANFHLPISWRPPLRVSVVGNEGRGFS